MELKVWADGIQRVVCGVTPNTTCQEVVIALAHAMGRTGRFTLVEKWRENERPLPPTECPLTVLQKWGEYASEVQFRLLTPEKESVKNKSKHFNSHERYKHNFTPPPSKTESVKRSSTFSGAHGIQLDKQKEILRVTPDKKLQNIDENCSKSISPSSNFLDEQKDQNQLSVNNNPHSLSPVEDVPLKHRQLPNIENISHSQKSSSAQNSTITQVKQNLKHVPAPPQKKQIVENNCDKKPSSISILPLVQKKKAPIPSPRKRGESLERNKASGVDVTLPLYSVAGKPRPEVEEYDLDRNFPDVVKDSNRDKIIEEYHVPDDEALLKPASPQGKKEPDPELLELMHLVTLQQGRMKTQESQIQRIDIELSPIEKYETVSESDLVWCKKQTNDLSSQERVNNSEITDLEMISWTEVVQRERILEKSLMEEIDSYHSKCDHCDSKISEIADRLVELSNQIELETAELEENKECQAAKEKETTDSLAQAEKELAKVQAELDSSVSLCEETENEANILKDELSKKSSEIANMEKELAEVNMKDFAFVSMKTESSKRPENASGDNKLRDNCLSPRFGKTRKIIASPLSKILSMTNNPNAVWV